MLLQDLLKHTWPDHVDYKNISNALSQITTTALYVNEKQKEAENIQKVLNIQSTLTGKNLKVIQHPLFLVIVVTTTSTSDINITNNYDNNTNTIIIITSRNNNDNNDNNDNNTTLNLILNITLTSHINNNKFLILQF